MENLRPGIKPEMEDGDKTDEEEESKSLPFTTQA